MFSTVWMSSWWWWMSNMTNQKWRFLGELHGFILKPFILSSSNVSIKSNYVHYIRTSGGGVSYKIFNLVCRKSKMLYQKWVTLGYWWHQTHNHLDAGNLDASIWLEMLDVHIRILMLRWDWGSNLPYDSVIVLRACLCTNFISKIGRYLNGH